MLILAGVSIAVLTGENGIINRTTEAKKTTEEAEVMEKIRLAFLNAQIGKYAGKNEEFAAVMQAELVKTLGTGATVETNADDFKVTYNGMIFDVTKTGVVNKVEGISIAESLTLKIIDGTPEAAKPLTATLNGISGTITWSKTDEPVSTEETETVSLSGTTGTTISVTPVSAGTAKITASCSGKSATCDVTVEAVNSVAVTFNLDGGNVSGNTANIVENELPGNPITLPKPTKTNYEFNGWDTTQNAATPSIAKTATTIEAPNSNTTYYAQWKQPSQAFRTYGTAVATNTTSGTYGTLGTSVALNGGNAISVGSGTIADNWKVFYEDSDFVYLIYGDYYPANVQTETATGSTIFVPAHKSDGTDSSYTYSVNSRTDRTTLLRYLRNYSNYSWNMSTTKDDFVAGGSQYTSWSNLQTVLSGLTALSGKTISIQGSPDIDLWVRSWEAKGNTDLKLTKETYGYNIMGASESSNSNYYINVRTDSKYNTTANETNHTGYYDTLYFPYRGNTTSDGEHAADALSYWLASPGANGDSRLCYVSYGGGVVCAGGYNADIYCARPVVSIAK